MISEIQDEVDEFGLDATVQKHGSAVYVSIVPDEYRFSGIPPKLGFVVTEYEWENGLKDISSVRRELACMSGWIEYCKPKDLSG